MAHKRKGQLIRPPEWWAHLRAFNKRLFWHRERRAAKRDIKKRQEEEVPK